MHRTTKDPNPPTERAYWKPAVLFAAGLVAGAAVGMLYGSGGFSRERETAPRPSSDEGAVTYRGGAAASPTAPASGALAGLLESGSVGGIDRTREVLAFVDGVKSGDLAARIDEVFARRRGNQGYDLVRSLYQKWVESDPAAALRHAEGLEGRNRSAALGTVLSAWAAKEPYEVIAWVEEHGNSQESQSAFHSALRAIAQDRPEEAIALAERAKFASRINPSFLYGIWAEKDPRAAAAGALSISHAQERKNALRMLASQWAKADPRAAWDWGSGLESASDRAAVLGMVVGGAVGNGDTSQAIAFFEAMPPGSARRQVLELIAASLAESDPERAYEFLRSQAHASGEEQVYGTILSRWARTDPARAFRIALEELDPGNARNSALQSVLNEVANRDAALALDMLGKLDEGGLRSASYSVAQALARNDRGAALAWAETLPDGDNKRNAFSSILSEWAQEAPQEASAFGLKIADEKLRRSSLGRALNQWADQDAVAAMTWAVENLGSEDQDNLVPGSLLGSCARQDTLAAAAWVAALPEGKLREQSIANLVSTWGNRDLVAAGEWLRRLPPGESRDRAAQQYASQVFDTDPEAALAWAESIGNEANRLSRMENLARRYLRDAPEKAKRWIAGSSLPPERKAELLKQADPK